VSQTLYGVSGRVALSGVSFADPSENNGVPIIGALGLDCSVLNGPAAVR
jgi:hypothetical protein